MIRWSQRLAAGWRRLWFAPDSARNLAFVRVVVAAHALWVVLSRDYAAVSGLPELWATVPDTLRWRYLLFEGHAGLERALQYAVVAALVAALLGVYPRVACLAAGLLLYHLTPLETIIWSPTSYGRGLGLAPILLVLLACVRSGDALRLWPRGPTEAAAGSWEYGWPRRLTFLLVAQIYLFSAWAKLTVAGPAWSGAENIRRWLLLYGLDERWRFHAAALWIAEHPGLCLALGIGTVVFEWSFVLAVFSRAARRVLVPAALLFQVGILVTMSIHVGETWLVVVFLEFDWVLRRLGYPATASATAPAALSGEAASST